MNFCAVLALLLAAADLFALAKPAQIEAIVRRAPTWEQLLARRQRQEVFSLRGQLARLSSLVGGARHQANPIHTAAATDE